MDLGLRDRVVVVTGGGAGIGGAVSRVLAEEGAVPVIVTRRAPDEAFMAGLRSLSPQAGVVLADLSTDAACRAAAAEVRSSWGPVWGLVNNAGANERMPT